VNQALKIILSRTDSIGDVMLTLPMAGVIKELYPQSHIIFLGDGYTKPVLEACEHIDHILDWEELKQKNSEEKLKVFKSLNADTIVHVFPNTAVASLAKKAGIPMRIGTSRRFQHLFNCNRLIYLKRKNSNLHEAQLNLKLLAPLNCKETYPLQDIPSYYGLTKLEPIKEELEKLVAGERYNLILHPKSKGSAAEWGLSNFSRLIEILPEEEYNIFITGTESEGEMLRGELPLNKRNVTDLTGKLTLSEFIGFTSKVDGLVAASTGTLHIAAALGKRAIGLFSQKRPIYPGRWMPLGNRAKAIVFDENCEKCNKGIACDCVTRISPERVQEELVGVSIKEIIDRQYKLG